MNKPKPTIYQIMQATMADARACERILGRPLTNGEYAWIGRFIGKLAEKGGLKA